MTWDQVGIAIFGVIAVALTQDSRENWRRWACVFGMAGQPFWFWSAAHAHQSGVLLVCCLYTLAWARGIYTNWIK